MHFSAITLGAGVQWYEAYEAIEKQGRFVVGGVSQGGSVGAAGGWAMGAGHSALSARHGLGIIPFLHQHDHVFILSLPQV